MSAEHIFSSIKRAVLLDVDRGLKIGQDANDYEKYSFPILSVMDDDQPLLFSYTQLRSRAVLKYRDEVAVGGYSLGTAIGYDIMVRHIASLGRKIDVTPLHIGTHDLTVVTALILAPSEGDKVYEAFDRRWFESSWVSHAFRPGSKPTPQEDTPEFRKFISQLSEAPIFASYLGHLNQLFGQQEPARQAVMTGIFDQTMIYHYRLQDMDGPDERYILGPDGKKVLPPSPSDIFYAQNPPTQ